MNIQTLKGFRDFLPKEARKRQYVLETLKKVFESYGFEPLETPALEYEEILTGKYGDEGDKLMYKFEDNGKRKVALRYDQTVPLARVVAEYQNDLPIPFKRYQIQNVWRAENTQKGRYRELLHVDADIVGSYSLLSDVEIIAVCARSLEKLGFKKFKILVNDRMLFTNLPNLGVTDKDIPIVVKAVDKLKKIGRQEVLAELTRNGIPENKANYLLETLENEKPTDRIKELIQALDKMGVDKGVVEFLPTLARGLDYYTGLIFEVEVEGYDVGSIAGGGRYDNLIGMFANKDFPSVGFAFGFDRLIEAMEELSLFPKSSSENNLLVAYSASDLQEKAMKVTNELREKGINVEFYLDDVTLEKQLKYADKKGLPFVLIINENKLVLKNMKSGKQEEVKLEEIKEKVS
ncbi:MAG: histidine--tRNA ligase [Candidatus Levybacteria bacterium RIFCSPLOWO2_01_FULL_36_13]|nr:MAG: histidine--tRNA ligase [Candidatus Levybacteria bacterium RIFCSPHIGHO2_01_FULL_36_15b]OGH35436.1 MAG: histidine--tRNA ligase [Candidatus Levybacteria bacterium RIFCSPLOWO2_01_FULL_36_13]